MNLSVSEQWEYLVPKSIPPSEREKHLKDLVGFKEYAPDSILNLESRDNYNPAIDIYQNTHNWDSGWCPVSRTADTVVPEYVPTDSAIDLLTELELIEIGAGGGYWSHVISENGGDCIPTDLNPRDVPNEMLPDGYWNKIEEVDFNFYFRDNNIPRPFDRCNSPPYETDHSGVWDKVFMANHLCVSSFSERDVFVCHPPVETWTEELLDLLVENQQKLVLVAEWFPGCDATPFFFHRLHHNWELEQTFPVYGWETHHVHGYVFKPPNRTMSPRESIIERD